MVNDGLLNGLLFNTRIPTLRLGVFPVRVVGAREKCDACCLVTNVEINNVIVRNRAVFGIQVLAAVLGDLLPQGNHIPQTIALQLTVTQETLEQPQSFSRTVYRRCRFRRESAFFTEEFDFLFWDNSGIRHPVTPLGEDGS